MPATVATIHSYKDLIVWQKSMDLVTEVYTLTEHFPKTEIYGLTDQMRRAAKSIPTNIAEGRKSGTRKNFVRFLYMSYASGSELETEIEIAKRLPFGKDLHFRTIDSLLEEVMKMLNVMLSKLRTAPKANNLQKPRS